MSDILFLASLLLLALLGGISVWGLSLSLFQENWKAVLFGFLLPPLLALWMLLRGQRPKGGSEGRYVLDGLLLSGSLFFPFLVTVTTFLLLVFLETYMLVQEGAREKNLDKKNHRKEED